MRVITLDLTTGSQIELMAMSGELCIEIIHESGHQEVAFLNRNEALDIIKAMRDLLDNEEIK